MFHNTSCYFIIQERENEALFSRWSIQPLSQTGYVATLQIHKAQVSAMIALMLSIDICDIWTPVIFKDVAH